MFVGWMHDGTKNRHLLGCVSPPASLGSAPLTHGRRAGPVAAWERHGTQLVGPWWAPDKLAQLGSVSCGSEFKTERAGSSFGELEPWCVNSGAVLLPCLATRSRKAKKASPHTGRMEQVTNENQRQEAEAVNPSDIPVTDSSFSGGPLEFL